MLPRGQEGRTLAVCHTHTRTRMHAQHCQFCPISHPQREILSLSFCSLSISLFPRRHCILRRFQETYGRVVRCSRILRNVMALFKVPCPADPPRTRSQGFQPHTYTLFPHLFHTKRQLMFRQLSRVSVLLSSVSREHILTEAA